ncbi:regulatory protein RecX [Blautia sp. MSJ-19]|uniref:regulatory protein RecX n=1 Tax=Blautia sp. MSJ-19 TaxID=2841517 RepID=UPI001C0EB907|nr:regulatory protein RecX [Blautia sp. MSJ-19]MBU5480835.1 recombination regulator RecX [Blautia sp. MSJ-19]
MTDMEQQQKEARKKALKLLEHMDRTEKGLYDRLLRAGFSEELSADAVAYVKDYGYVDDKRYAMNYLMYRIHEKSRQKLFQELQQKGISRQIIQTAWEEMAELEEPDERKLLRQMIEKKCQSGSRLDEKEMRRLFGYLARRGFRSGDIFSVLEEMDISQQFPE